MNIGDYVRTEKGVIGKYNIVKKGETIPNWNGGYGYKEIEKEYIDNIIYNKFDDKIIKSSPNIIDLIQKGDYVNESKVIDISTLGKDKEKWVWVEQMEDTDNKYGDDYVGYNNEQIKSIVTKEQFENMEYKVK